ncbi:hypothetical protein [Massilia glaciei]|uniref:hypothetical protein n=1 Tax=Massilia glaciei TaxID=1524097 RepID=UPI0015E7FE21|nr:hypothetical protein [Massilia glaciei]
MPAFVQYQEKITGFALLFSKDLFALFALDNLQRHPLAESIGPAIGMLAHAGHIGHRIKAEQKDLVLVYVLVALSRPSLADRRTAGTEVESGRTDVFAGQGFELGTGAEIALDPGWQIGLEIVEPVTGVGPTSISFRRAADVERRFQSRVAKCDHRFGEAGGDLAHIFDGPFGIERLHHGARIG